MQRTPASVIAAMRSGSAPGPCRIHTGVCVAVATSREVSGVRRCVSITTRTGWRGV